MDVTHKAPSVPLDRQKRTKIIATLGPAVDSYPAVLALIKAGVNGVRLNFSHGTYDERKKQIDWVRKAAREYGKPLALIQDLQGPKIRLGDFEGIITVQAGKEIRLKYKADYEAEGVVPLQYDLSKKVARGERMFVNDGRLHFVISAVKNGEVFAKAQNDGVLLRRKGINLPDTNFDGDIITIKDKKDLAFGSEHDFDYVALSFVQTANDIAGLKRLLVNLGSPAKVMAKIETKTAVENIESIVAAADAVMIARGDLAIETEPESVPIVQRMIIELGQKYARPTVVATQMLSSMSETPQPTRAEVSDVATAVLGGADCVMLSDETASGKYPIEAVQVMKRVILYTQANMPYGPSPTLQPDQTTRQGAICSAIINLASSVGANAIVAETRSGATALQMACRRPNLSVIAVTSDARVANQLAIVYGLKSYVRPDDKLAAVKLTNWLKRNKVLKPGDVVVTCSGQYPGVVGTTDTIKVRAIN